MLLDIREREREAQANRLVQGGARPVPVARVNPPEPARQHPAGVLERAFGFFQPAVPEPPRQEPPQPVPRFNDGGDFEWMDNPSAYARCTVTFATLILTSRYESRPPIHPRDDYDPYLRVL